MVVKEKSDFFIKPIVILQLLDLPQLYRIQNLT